MSWKTNLVLNFTDGKSYLMFAQEITDLLKAEDPVRFLQKIAKKNGKQFESLTIKLQKSGTLGQEDIFKLSQFLDLEDRKNAKLEIEK